MFITVCVIAYNEQDSLPSILNDIEAQDYDHQNIEIVLVDSNSTDNTKNIMMAYKENNLKDARMHFRDVRVLSNLKKTLPCGWNVALNDYKGEAILKVDAHASIPKDFVSKNVAVLESGEDISGGQRPTITDEHTSFKDTLQIAESSMFGSSIAPYRNNPGKTYVNSMFHAAYRREVFEKTGMFNEKLARTEDNEIHYRMRKAGFRLCFSPDIISYQHTRSSLSKMLKQKYANGYWIGLTLGVCPKCLSAYHFVPFLFVAAIIISTVLCMAFSIGTMLGVTAVGIMIIGNIVKFLTMLMWGMYWILAVIMAIAGVITSPDERNITCIILPFLFFMLHISYGIGTLIGLVKLPSWKKKNNM